MKTLFILWLFLIPGKDVLFFRELLTRAATSEEAAQLMFKRSAALDSDNEVLKGYAAMSYLMMSKYAGSPMQKLSYFREGKNRLEAAITRSPGNIELLYLRFSVQSNLPAFLGYYRNKTEDKLKLMAWLKTGDIKDTDLRARVLDFLKQSDELNDAEKRVLSPAL